MNIYEKANACCMDIQQVESWELRVMICFCQSLFNSVSIKGNHNFQLSTLNSQPIIALLRNVKSVSEP